jgi:hypothetical protein
VGTSGQLVRSLLACSFGIPHCIAACHLVRPDLKSRLRGDRGRSPRIVACHHCDLHPGCAALADCLRHFRPYRILHSGETKKDEIDQMTMSKGLVGIAANFTFGKGQDS